MNKLKRTILLLALLAILSAVAFANVSLRNGNFFIGYTDVIYSGGFEPKIERVYNSKTGFKGIYGWGWGGEYEVYLEPLGDGTIVMHEYGGGAENLFSRQATNETEIKAVVDEMMRVAIESGKFKDSTGDAAKYRERLLNDASFRSDEWRNFKKLNLVAEKPLPVGTVLYSNRFSYQYITRTRDGYTRIFDNGRIETYNLQGRLVRIKDKNGNFIDFERDATGNFITVTDNLGRKIRLSYNSRGLVDSLTDDRGRKAVYKYDDESNLIYSKDVDGNEYGHEYDRTHNMTRIRYSDKTTLDISYYGRDKLQNVRSVKDRDGTLTTYSYETKKESPQLTHLIINVAVRDSDNKEISKSIYEYHFARTASGIEWTQKMITDLDGDRTETTYSEVGNLPISIKRYGEETKFEYNAKGQVTRKETPSEITETKYNDAVGKVSFVQKTNKSSKNKQWSKFEYDASGNLIMAENSNDDRVELKYDSIGRIAVMISKDKSQLEFEYNKNSKPVVIRQVKDAVKEEITVKYTESGEIEKVDSTAGRQVALKVTSAFQKLLEIIRPAGVSLSF